MAILRNCALGGGVVCVCGAGGVGVGGGPYWRQGAYLKITLNPGRLLETGRLLEAGRLLESLLKKFHEL